MRRARTFDAIAREFLKDQCSSLALPVALYMGGCRRVAQATLAFSAGAVVSGTFNSIPPVKGS
jgi:hypothetical protein